MCVYVRMYVYVLFCVVCVCVCVCLMGDVQGSEVVLAFHLPSAAANDHVCIEHDNCVVY